MPRSSAAHTTCCARCRQRFAIILKPRVRSQILIEPEALSEPVLTGGLGEATIEVRQRRKVGPQRVGCSSADSLIPLLLCGYIVLVPLLDGLQAENPRALGKASCTCEQSRLDEGSSECVSAASQPAPLYLR